MIDEALERLMADLESDRVERKQTFKGKEQEVRQAVCAFANDLPGHGAPGVIFIGVDDAGDSAGFPITDELLRALSDIRSDGNILPLPAMTVEKRRLWGADVAVITVLPAYAPPVRFKGVIWVRVGPRRAIASEQEERLLSERRRTRDPNPDIRPVYEATLEELDERFIRETYLPSAIDPQTLAANQREFEHQLTSLRFVHPGEPHIPTVLGILIAGRRPTFFIPGAYLSFVRFAGTSATDPVVSNHEIRSPVSRLIGQVDELFNLHVMTKVDFTSASTELRRPDYPTAALQQIVRNAILHRTYDGTNAPVRVYWYSDRVEIINPGGAYGIVTQNNFGAPGITDYRNPHLAEAMRNLGFVQRFGVGIQVARDALRRNGNPPPEFVVEPHSVIATMRRQPVAAD